MMSVDEMRRESGLKGDYWFYKVDYVPPDPFLSLSLNLIWLFCLSRQVPDGRALMHSTTDRDRRHRTEEKRRGGERSG